jgi:hypothetical protein
LLGSDDINVLEVSENGKHFDIKFDTERENHHLDLLKKNDIINIKTFHNVIETAKIIHNHGDSLTIMNDTLKLEDFIQSMILNWKAQYFIVFGYHTK